jgi:hypothetical protein
MVHTFKDNEGEYFLERWKANKTFVEIISGKHSGVRFSCIKYGNEPLFRDREKLPICHDCNAKPGQFHKPDCDMEICPICGDQLMTCGCDIKTSKRIRWNIISSKSSTKKSQKK